MKAPVVKSILRNAAIPNYLKPMPFQKVRGVPHEVSALGFASSFVLPNKIRFLGGKLGKAFAEEYDASTVGDLL